MSGNNIYGWLEVINGDCLLNTLQNRGSFIPQKTYLIPFNLLVSYFFDIIL